MQALEEDAPLAPDCVRGDLLARPEFLGNDGLDQGCIDAEQFDRKLHEIGSGGLLPDRTLLLRLDAEAAARRASKRDSEGADRIGARDGSYHAKVAEAFARLATDEPKRFRAVEAGGPPEEVTSRLLAELEDLL